MGTFPTGFNLWLCSVPTVSSYQRGTSLNGLYESGTSVDSTYISETVEVNDWYAWIGPMEESVTGTMNYNIHFELRPYNSSRLFHIYLIPSYSWIESFSQLPQVRCPGPPHPLWYPLLTTSFFHLYSTVKPVDRTPSGLGLSILVLPDLG